MKLILLLLAALAVSAQTEMRLSQRNPDTGYQFVLGYSGSNLIYACKAASIQPVSPSISIASASNASPVVFTISGGHGFNLSSTPTVTIAGGTGNWAAVNGSFTATVINTTTYSIVVDSTAFGAVTGTLTYTTRAPRITSAVWSIQKLIYDGSNNLIFAAWDSGTPSYTRVCSGNPAAAQ